MTLLAAVSLSSPAIAQEEPPRATIDPREEFRALLMFRDEHLSLREERRFVPGRTTVLAQPWGFGPRPYWGFGWQGNTVVTVEPPTYESEWAVFEGGQRLSVPMYLRATEQVSSAELLERKIERARDVSVAARAIGWVGIVGGLVSTVLAVNADASDEVRTLSVIGASSAGAGLVSLAIGGSQRSRARRLTFDFEASKSLGDVRREVRDYNVDLMDRLDLSPRDALRELGRSWDADDARRRAE